MRWRAKASQMIDRPPEEEQVDIIVKNLLPTYQIQLCTQYLPTFQSLIATANKIEDLVQTGQLKDELSKYKKPSQAQSKEIANITPVNPLRMGDVAWKKDANSRPKRQFSELGLPITKVFQLAVQSNYLQPSEARPPPNPLP